MTMGAIDDEAFDSFDGSTKQKENLQKEYALKSCVKDGIYATYIKQKSGGSYLGTRADYLGMRPGNNIYFFFNRCIYGIGEIVGIDDTCVFVHSNDNSLYDYKDNEKCPFICLFKSSPHFFKNGVDMDDVLSSNPDAFRMLRVFHQRSFIKIDDVENLALKSFIIQRNEQNLGAFDIHKHYDASNQENTYNIIRNIFIQDKMNIYWILTKFLKRE